MLKNILKLKNVQKIKKQQQSSIYGGGSCCDALNGCIDTAENDGNEWLIPECTRILGSCCFS